MRKKKMAGFFFSDTYNARKPERHADAWEQLDYRQLTNLWLQESVEAQKWAIRKVARKMGRTVRSVHEKLKQLQLI